MKDMDRRTTIALGLATVVVPAFEWSYSAITQTHAPTEGWEIGPGVLQVDPSERPSVISSYKIIKMRDIIIQPGASTPGCVMMNDMLCHTTEGELSVRKNDERFTVRKGQVWVCAKGVTTEGTRNTGSSVAVMRINDLLPG